MNSSLVAWVAVVVAGIVTYLERAAFILVLGRRELPPSVRRALAYVAPAAFAAIVAPRVLSPADGAGLVAVDARLPAALIGCWVMWRFRSMPLTLLAGMGSFWLLRFLL